jgi:predicted amidohydrolase YtcJ
VHLFELGASLERVRLVGVTTEADVVERVAARAATTPKGEWIKAGFQIAVHAIGDAANTAVLDFFENAARAIPASASARHRIEHAQVVARADITRFATLGIIASMQPSHAVEDMPWAGARLGPLRVEGLVRVADAAAGRRATCLQFRSAGHRLRLLLRAALGRHAAGS